jgi:hypothetical protein
MNKEKILDTESWKIEHRSDGLSFISYPYKYTENDKMKDIWFGPFDKFVAEWLIDAIKLKQGFSKPQQKDRILP